MEYHKHKKHKQVNELSKHTQGSTAEITEIITPIDSTWQFTSSLLLIKKMFPNHILPPYPKLIIADDYAPTPTHTHTPLTPSLAISSIYSYNLHV